MKRDDNQPANAPGETSKPPRRAKANAKAATKAKPASPAPPATKAPREGTKQAQLMALLKRPKGVTIAEVTEVFGWLPHTARAAISHGLGKRLGLKVTAAPDAKRGRVYRIAD